MLSPHAYGVHGTAGTSRTVRAVQSIPQLDQQCGILTRSTRCCADDLVLTGVTSSSKVVSEERTGRLPSLSAELLLSHHKRRAIHSIGGGLKT